MTIVPNLTLADISQKRASMPEVAGIDQQAEVLGAAAVDLLVAQYQQNERGIPETPKIVMTEGMWRDAKV